MRNNVYGNYDEKYVKTVIVYAGEDNVLYFDEGFNNPVSSKDLYDLFLKGLTINYSSKFCKPVNCVVDEDKTTVGVVEGSETVSIVEFTSKEPEETSQAE